MHVTVVATPPPPPHPLTRRKQPMVGCGVFDMQVQSWRYETEAAWYKKMRQTSHKESSGPVAIMLFILGVRQSSINMVFSSLSEVFSLEVVWVYHLKIRSNLVIGSWPLLCVGR